MRKRTYRERIGDTFVSVDVETEPAVVDFGDILEAVKIESDDDYGAPWDDCDGWEHEAVPASRVDGDAHEYRGACWSAGDREQVVIVLGPEADDGWGNYAYHRASGASRQVAAEAVATTRQKAVDQLRRWYAYGWSCWYVGGEYNGCNAGVGGVFDDDGSYAEDTRVEMAEEIAAQLEADNYTVTGKPEPRKTLKYGWSRDQWREEYKRRLHAQDWQGETRRYRR